MKSRSLSCLPAPVALWCAISCAWLLSGCPVLYPEIATPIRSASARDELEPGPPADVVFMRFAKAWIPLRTRDGREWTGGAPDPYAVVLVDGKELFRTPIQPRTHQPTWPDGPAANYRISDDNIVLVELWDEGTFTAHPICAKEVERPHAVTTSGSVELVCASGARITLEIEPARPKFGLGLWYEVREESVYITRVIKESPAGRAGLEHGHRVLSIQGREVAGLDAGQIRSAVNANRRTGLVLTVLQRNGKTRTAHLQEGPIYMLADEE